MYTAYAETQTVWLEMNSRSNLTIFMAFLVKHTVILCSAFYLTTISMVNTEYEMFHNMISYISPFCLGDKISVVWEELKDDAPSFFEELTL